MAFDPYGKTHELSPEATQAIANRLEERGQVGFFVQMIDDYLAEMAVPHLSRVLDIGCGTGIAARRLASHPNFSGTILGIDRSAVLIETAKNKASEEGLAEKISFAVGEAAELGEQKGQFDAAIAHTLVSHVDDPDAVLEEISSCVRPGGPIAIFDGDYASTVYGGDHADIGEKLAAAVVNGLITNPNIMRTLPANLRALGLRLTTMKSYVVAEAGESSSFFESAFASFPTLLPASGVAERDQVERWVETERQNIVNGTFFGAVNFYAYVARREG